MGANASSVSGSSGSTYHHHYYHHHHLYHASGSSSPYHPTASSTLYSPSAHPLSHQVYFSTSNASGTPSRTAPSTAAPSPTPHISPAASIMGYRYPLPTDHLCGALGSPAASNSVVLRDKKRRITGFATLRKKLIRRRRTSKSLDHAKVIREFVSDWSPRELHALVEEYEATSALKDLIVQADLARPPAPTYKEDLAALFDRKQCTDIDLIFQGAIFPAHRAILCSRCPYFRELLSKHPGYGAQVPVYIRTPGVDVSLFTALLRYLYMGDFASPSLLVPGSDVTSAATRLENLDMVFQLAEEFGTPNALEADLKYLLETGDYADAVLVFSNLECNQQTQITQQQLQTTGKPSSFGGPASLPTAGFCTGSASICDPSSLPCPSELTTSTLSGFGVIGGLSPSCAFSASGVGLGQLGGSIAGVCSEYGFTAHKLEFLCHKAVLAARSSFFRGVILRRNRGWGRDKCSSEGKDDSVPERATPPLRTPTRIVLDESVIPRRYARVLLHAIYLDTVDLSTILHTSGSSGALSELACVGGGTLGGHSAPVGAASSGSSASHGKKDTPHPMSIVEEAMEVYHIGRFLELDILVQGCEDIIASNLSLETLVPILRWSQQPHGSAWVHRQALHFLREEFQSIMASPVLHELDKTHMIEALQSDFLQVSELEVLQGVLKWGEHQLIRRMEEREPNLLSHTAHSVAKKGVKKRDLSDIELREILSELLPLVRVDHILPPNSEVLTNAIRRGLVSTPPSHMIGDDISSAVLYRINAWVRGKNNGLFVKPRLFTPYAEEVKVLLDDQMVQQLEMVRLRMVRMSQHIPDTLYMVDKPLVPACSAVLDRVASMGGSRTMYAAGLASKYPSAGMVGNLATVQPPGTLDIAAAGVPVPEPDVLQVMLKREQELRQSAAAQRAYGLSLSDRWEISRQIQLRVVREFGFPDSMADVLHSATYYCAYPDMAEIAAAAVLLSTSHPSTEQQHHKVVAPRHATASTNTAHVVSRRNVSYHTEPTMYLPESNPYRGLEVAEGGSCDGHLSDIMPDIAMATTSFSQMHLQEGELELDLGDGTTHPGANLYL